MEEMAKEAEGFAESDKAKREAVETRNEADAAVSTAPPAQQAAGSSAAENNLDQVRIDNLPLTPDRVLAAIGEGAR